MRYRRTHCRCRSCGTRRCLPRHPDYYTRLPRCRVCGERTFRVDRWMMQRNTHKTACLCGGDGHYINRHGNPFPHRLGSLRCHYNADGTYREIDEPIAA